MQVLLIALTLLSAGCASVANQSNTKPLDARMSSSAAIEGYTVLTVMPFVLATGVVEADPEFGANFSADIVARMRTDYPDVFREVRWNKTDRVPGEVLVEGTIRTYDPGSALARAFMIPLESSFQGDVVLRDAQDGSILLSGPFDEFWVLGGMFTSKAIDNQVAATSVAITKTIAHWKQGSLRGQAP